MMFNTAGLGIIKWLEPKLGSFGPFLSIGIGWAKRPCSGVAQAWRLLVKRVTFLLSILDYGGIEPAYPALHRVQASAFFCLPPQ